MTTLTTVTVRAALLLGAAICAYGQLNQNCTVCVLNRCVRANADGSWVLPNIPAGFGQVKARATCEQGGVTTSGESAFFRLDANTAVNLPEIVIGSASQIPISLTLAPSAPALSTIGQAVQLTVTANYPNSSTANVTAGTTGTNYTSSNPAIASISANGLITAVSSGTVIIQANNDGATGMITARVTLSNTDSDGDGIPDDVEIANGLNPNNPIDAQEDFDRDNLTNAQEISRGTGIRNPDTDSDGLKDGDEVTRGTNPLLADSDGDLIPDGVEITNGTNPLDRLSYDLRAAITGSNVTPASFNLVTSTVNPNVSIQLTWRVNLIDGKTTLDLTADPRTNYSSNDLNVCNLSATKGRISAGTAGSCVITITNGTLSTTVSGRVTSFSPTEVSSLTVSGAVAVDVAGSYAYVAAGAGGLVVVDITDRSRPAIRATLSGLGTVSAVRAFGQYLLVADSAGFFRVVNVQSPVTPVLAASIPILGSPNYIAVRGTMAAVSAGGGGVTFVNVSAPASPAVVSQFASQSAAQGVDLDTQRGLAVIAMGTGGLQVVDISNLAAPQARGVVAGGDVRRVLLRYPGAILADAQRGYTSVNVTNPAAPALGAPIPETLGGRPVDVTGVGILSMIADISFGRAIPIVSIADPLQPTPLAFWNLGAGAFSSSIAMDNSYGYLITPGTMRIGKYQNFSDGFGVRPAISLTSPPSGAILIQGQTITVAANATDDVGVSSVNFLIGGQTIATSATAPYQFTYTVPATSSSLTFGATAVDYGGNVGNAANVTVQVIPDPLTTVRGRVIDQSSNPVSGVAVSVLGISTTSIADGTFTIPGLPTIRGAIVVTAVATVNGTLLGGSSPAKEPILAGITDVGDLRLGPKPFLTSVLPKSVLAGTTTQVAVTGSNLGGAAFDFAPAGIFVSAVAVNPGGTSATMNLTVSSLAKGRFTVVATNPAGSTGATAVLGFVRGSGAFNSIIVPGPDGSADDDRDSLSNAQETIAGTDPLNPDTDGDGFPDGMELGLGSDPLDSLIKPVIPKSSRILSTSWSVLSAVPPPQPSPLSQPRVLSSSFGLLNSVAPPQPPLGSQPRTLSASFALLNAVPPPQPLPGTQSRNLFAQFSVLNGSGSALTSTPKDRAAALSEFAADADDDRDGLPNWLELRLGSNPNAVDTDGDGIPDGVEFQIHGHPLAAQPLDDDDHDGLDNLTEVRLGTDPGNPDSDGDGLLDGDELLRQGTHPMVADSDGDGVSDGEEIRRGSDPLNRSSRPDGVAIQGTPKLIWLQFSISNPPVSPKGKF